MNNKLILGLYADDKISPVLQRGARSWVMQASQASRGINRSFSGALTSARTQLNNLMNTPITLPGLGGGSSGSSGGMGMLGSVLFGSLGATAITTAIGGIQSGINGVIGSLRSAASFETATIGISSDIGTNLGLDLDRARSLQEGTQKEIAQLAAILPGVTQDYSNILNGMAPAISSAFRGNVEGYQDTILDMTKRVGVLAAKSQADPTMAGNALNRFVSGTTGFQEVMMIDIFQKNAMFQQALRDGLTQLGIGTDQWKDLTTEQRLAITQNALKIATPDTLLEAFKGTAEASLQEMQTRLFDPMLGVFGVMRDINGRSALDAFSGFLQAFMGLSDAVSEMLAANGVSIDPMAGLILLFDFLTRLSNSAAEMMQSASGVDLGGFDLSRIFSSDLFLNLGNYLANAINGLGAYLLTLDWNAFMINFQNFIWTALGWLGYTVVSTAQGIDYSILKQLFWKGLEMLGVGLLQLFSNVLEGVLHWLGFIESESNNQFIRIADGLERWYSNLMQVIEMLKGYAARALNFVTNNPIMNPVGAAVSRVTGVSTSEALGAAVNGAANLLGIGGGKEETAEALPGSSSTSTSTTSSLRSTNSVQNDNRQASVTNNLTINTTPDNVERATEGGLASLGRRYGNLKSNNLAVGMA